MRSSRIATVSPQGGVRNVSFTTEGKKLSVYIRTSTGEFALRSQADTIATRLQHLVVTRAATGAVSLYVDGAEVESGASTGDFSTWDTSYPMSLGNSLSLDRSWLGTMYLVAVYSRALGVPEVSQNFAAGP